jgi:SWI/SNF-related matrix-associated actin-dependent regulator 1 of chromatin subfamily A
MKIIETSREFEISFDYDRRIVALLQKEKASRWNPVRKLWTLPKSSRDFVNELNKKFGNQIGERPEVYDKIPDLPELEIEIPLKRELFPFQKKGVAYALQQKRLIIGDQPGLGKTSQAIAALIAADAFPVLIVCPASLRYNWQAEFETVAGMKSIIMSEKVRLTWRQYYRAGLCKVFITNYESLKKYFVDRIDQPKDVPLRLNHIHFSQSIQEFKAVVYDEIHRCKEAKTQQAKFAKGIASGKEYIFGLSGTPLVNKPKDLLSQISIIGRLPEFGGYTYFLKRYCGDNGNGASNLHELNYKLATTCFYQRQKHEVLKELPDKIRQVITCHITTRKEYLAAVNDLAHYLKDFKQRSEEQISISLRGEIMVKIGICKNISARGKLPEVFEYIDEIIDSGEKVVIFIHQKEIARSILQQYPSALTITGDDSAETRDSNVKKFQSNPAFQLIVCNIKAGGVGITLTAASRVGFVELPWHAADCDQCEDRCHRIGQKDSVQATYFIGKNTIDEDIFAMIEEKRKVANTVTGTVDNVQRQLISKLLKSENF